jgi:hypothetical protein
VSAPRIWAPIMFAGEFDMFDLRMEAFEPAESVRHLVVESPFTHRGVPKPVVFDAFSIGTGTRHGVQHIVDDREPGPAPWANEHRQRAAAWPVIDAEADDGDVVLIADCDEIPSPELLSFIPLWASSGGAVLSVPMRTYLFAVDWIVAVPVPPPCVLAKVGYLRERAARGEYLGEVRDGRGRYPAFHGHGGWHFSWCGGPAVQRAKLETSTCHTEIFQTPEADLIRSGARWRSQEDGGGLPVVPVEVDETYPAYIREGRCPASWRRPREAVA